MNKEQALNLIEQALNVATQKGVFNLTDVQAILNAISVIKSSIEDKKQEP